MKQLHFFKYTTILLLVLNIGVITFFMITSRGVQVPVPDERGALEILHLSAKQGRQFHELVTVHHKQMRRLNTAERDLLAQYFGHVLATSDKSTPKTALLMEIEQIHKEKLSLTYQHFEEVKEMLTPEQVPYLKEFITDVMKNQGHAKKRPFPPKDLR
ncbi:hypothetical protein NBRC110019_31710 [Neptunitalea chrysea]|uniref:Periplasmic heavy metal sensor n=1 Tax=Neptunitalea chrysea TaxID=1647581 RepID=A0A9W6B7Q4_9FLAO|nr:hypothetical protein [Neptunitalea chrysea]GLB54130.1 hypothetical protein NBRC110019_31710 [Neptunitalea chrysea]